MSKQEEIMHYDVYVGSILVIDGYNSENADFDNPSGAYYRERYFVEVVLPSGQRFEHVDRFKDEDEAYMLRADVEKYLNENGKLPKSGYAESAPVYGSDYYCSSGREQEVIAWERNQQFN
jgi:hypothetical protein